MKQSFLFNLIFVLLFSINSSAQNCYEIVESNTGIEALYNNSLLTKSCEVTTLVNAVPGNQFEVLSFDFYPPQVYTNPQDGFNKLFNDAKASLDRDQNRQSYYLLTKEHQKDGQLNYRLNIKFPTNGNFGDLSPIDKDAITKLVLNEINSKASNNNNSSFQNPDAEIAGLNKIIELFGEVINGTLDLGEQSLELAGFEGVDIDTEQSFNRTGDLYEGNDSNNSQNYIYDYTGLKVADASSGMEYCRDVVSVQLQEETNADFLTHAYIITDTENTTGQLSTAANKFESTEEKIIIWLHFYKNNGDYTKVYIKYNDNLTDAEAENMVNLYFEETMRLWMPELYGTDSTVARSGEEPHQNNLVKSNPSCNSFSWKYGKDCLLPYVSNEASSPTLQAAKFGAGLGVGLFDGLMGTLEFIYKTGKVSKEVGGGLWKKISSYAKDLAIHAINKRSMLSVLSKVSEDSVAQLQATWKTVVNIYEVTVNLLSVGISEFDCILEGILLAMQAWIGPIIAGTAEGGYNVGVLAFDLITTAFSGGSATGAKFIPKIMKWIKSLKNDSFDMVAGMMSKVDNAIPSISGLSGKVSKCKILGGGCFVKDTPVLIARNRTIFGDSQNEGPQVTFERDMRGQKIFNLKNGAKSLALAAAMPIVAVPIQEVQLLDYAVAHETVNSDYGITASTDDTYMGLFDKDPYTSDQQRTRDKYELNDKDWNEVVFEEVLGTSTCKLALHQDWINQKAYFVDGVVNLDLPEQGISGPFRITSIKHIVPQKKPVDDDEADDYNYRPVTALFTHESNQVYTIDFDNGESLGVTYQHPIFSTRAGNWKLAGELEIGEEVLTKSGNTKVISSTKKEGSETVYNLEIKELHNFLVGESGIVVHNNYNIAQAIVNALKNVGNQFNYVLGNFSTAGRCADKAKALRTHLKSKGHKNVVSERLQYLDSNGNPIQGQIGWDVLDANGNIIETHIVANNGFHEFTRINGKVYDNISPNGIDYADFKARLVPDHAMGIHEFDFNNPIFITD